MHDENDLAKTRRNLDSCRINLANAGLSDPGSVAAFHGALFAGADAAMAFEAARRHELLMIPDEPYVTQTQRRYQDGNAYDAAVRRLHEWRERIRGLPNPFREPDAAAQQWGIAA